MLVLTRRSDEIIHIGKEIIIKILSIKGNQVRLGFEAPRDIAIHCKENYQRVQDSMKLNQDDIHEPI